MFEFYSSFIIEEDHHDHDNNTTLSWKDIFNNVNTLEKDQQCFLVLIVLNLAYMNQKSVD